ncbi:transcriptional regulator [Curtobacterium sp. MCPF17_047]|uniref:helix-turn-helix domain-containing protein n=1 Tax=unclassified Curtobacterium TaxID=257496 RepID=UPI000DAA893D|nr:MULTISPECIES: helix-turn-helix transcriptional regulator [unclassified Curtobacterium]PZE62899.1 transcriptional regulator [Curtobacterium sp. MCPF17_001]PZF68828.1 transcriptional regulator [Curtobacterium sp. MCPF17_047]
MDTQAEIRDFLTSRRARLTPEQIGLPDFGGRRRVAGLRREEVALVAGISVEYYTRLERGNATGVSDSVLDGVTRALLLDDVEATHLVDLVRAANAPTSLRTRRSAQRPQHVSASVQQIVDGMTDMPVIVQNTTLDVVASNRLGRAFYSDLFGTPGRSVDFGRYIFLDPRSHDFYRDWDSVAVQSVAVLRTEAARTPGDRALTTLVGELSVASEAFRTLWASHTVREHRSGQKLVHHPIVGDLDLTFESLDIGSRRGLALVTYLASPGSASHDSLQLLAHWAVTNDTGPVRQPRTTER